MPTINIHCGHMSVDNGAVFPVSVMFDLAKACDGELRLGQHYGHDMLDVSEEHLPLVEELLIESRMLYRVVGTHDSWQNIQTPKVRDHLAHRTC